MILKTVNDTIELGSVLSGVIQCSDRIAVQGPLGSGKTTLIRGIVQGFDSSIQVKSPTYSIYNLYPTAVPVYHFDFYRLQEKELASIGFDEILDDSSVVIIAEWAEKARGYTRDWLWVSMDYFQLYKRQIRFSTFNNERYAERFKRFLAND